MRVLDAYSPRAPIAEVLWKLLPEIPREKDDLFDAVFLEEFDEVFRKRLPVNGDERLRRRER